MRWSKKSSAVIARELAVPSDQMANFISGNRTLPSDTLCALCTYLFGGAAEFITTFSVT